jgi:hypothetical protein
MLPHPGAAPSLRNPALWLSDRPVTLPVGGISMAPFLEEGDRVEVILAGRSVLDPGDLIVFLRGEEVVIHRLLAARGGRFLEKGDAQARGNWASWPQASGKAVAIWKGGERMDLSASPWPGRMRALARIHLRAHRVWSFAEKLPGPFFRGAFLRLCRLPSLLRL